MGAWIPDQADAKRGGAGSRQENHILKIAPLADGRQERFIKRKQDQIGELGTHRMTAQFIESDTSLDNAWWGTPYKGDVDRPGQHLPNRAMALSTTLKDLLLLGNDLIDALLPGAVRFRQYLDRDCCTDEEAAAMYFFMLSHFVADGAMPCHCDNRKLASYGEGVHREWEQHWSKKIGTFFEKEKLLPVESGTGTATSAPRDSEVLDEARQRDGRFGIGFGSNAVPDLIGGHDVWLEMMQVCRGSFALASIVCSPGQYPYDDEQARARFDQVLGGANEQRRDALDAVIMHDAVLNTAIVWKHIWNKVSAD